MSEALDSIEGGTENPYHGKPPRDLYETAALGILDNLSGRGSIKHALREIDDDIKEEIVQTLADIIHAALPLSSRAGPLEDEDE